MYLKWSDKRRTRSEREAEGARIRQEFAFMAITPFFFFFLEEKVQCIPEAKNRRDRVNQNPIKEIGGEGIDRLPPVAMLMHGIRDLNEARNVGASQKGRKNVISMLLS